MKKIDRVLKQLSELYEFYKRIKQYRFKQEPHAD